MVSNTFEYYRLSYFYFDALKSFKNEGEDEKDIKNGKTIQIETYEQGG